MASICNILYFVYAWLLGGAADSMLREEPLLRGSKAWLSRAGGDSAPAVSHVQAAQASIRREGRDSYMLLPDLMMYAKRYRTMYERQWFVNVLIPIEMETKTQITLKFHGKMMEFVHATKDLMTKASSLGCVSKHQVVFGKINDATEQSIHKTIATLAELVVSKSSRFGGLLGMAGSFLFGDSHDYSEDINNLKDGLKSANENIAKNAEEISALAGDMDSFMNDTDSRFKEAELRDEEILNRTMEAIADLAGTVGTLTTMEECDTMMVQNLLLHTRALSSIEADLTSLARTRISIVEAAERLANVNFANAANFDDMPPSIVRRIKDTVIKTCRRSVYACTVATTDSDVTFAASLKRMQVYKITTTSFVYHIQVPTAVKAGTLRALYMLAPLFSMHGGSCMHGDFDITSSYYLDSTVDGLTGKVSGKFIRKESLSMCDDNGMSLNCPSHVSSYVHESWMEANVELISVNRTRRQHTVIAGSCDPHPVAPIGNGQVYIQRDFDYEFHKHDGQSVATGIGAASGTVVRIPCDTIMVFQHHGQKHIQPATEGCDSEFQQTQEIHLTAIETPGIDLKELADAGAKVLSQGEVRLNTSAAHINNFLGQLRSIQQNVTQHSRAQEESHAAAITHIGGSLRSIQVVAAQTRDSAAADAKHWANYEVKGDGSSSGGSIVSYIALSIAALDTIGLVVMFVLVRKMSSAAASAQAISLASKVAKGAVVSTESILGTNFTLNMSTEDMVVVKETTGAEMLSNRISLMSASTGVIIGIMFLVLAGLIAIIVMSDIFRRMGKDVHDANVKFSTIAGLRLIGGGELGGTASTVMFTSNNNVIRAKRGLFGFFLLNLLIETGATSDDKYLVTITKQDSWIIFPILCLMMLFLVLTVIAACLMVKNMKKWRLLSWLHVREYELNAMQADSRIDEERRQEEEKAIYINMDECCNCDGAPKRADTPRPSGSGIPRPKNPVSKTMLAMPFMIAIVLGDTALEVKSQTTGVSRQYISWGHLSNSSMTGWDYMRDMYIDNTVLNWDSHGEYPITEKCPGPKHPFHNQLCFAHKLATAKTSTNNLEHEPPGGCLRFPEDPVMWANNGSCTWTPEDMLLASCVNGASDVECLELFELSNTSTIESVVVSYVMSNGAAIDVTWWEEKYDDIQGFEISPKKINLKKGCVTVSYDGALQTIRQNTDTQFYNKYDKLHFCSRHNDVLYCDFLFMRPHAAPEISSINIVQTAECSDVKGLIKIGSSYALVGRSATIKIRVVSDGSTLGAARYDAGWLLEIPIGQYAQSELDQSTVIGTINTKFKAMKHVSDSNISDGTTPAGVDYVNGTTLTVTSGPDSCKPVKKDCNTYHLPCEANVVCDSMFGPSMHKISGELKVQSMCLVEHETLLNLCGENCTKTRLNCDTVLATCPVNKSCETTEMFIGAAHLDKQCDVEGLENICPASRSDSVCSNMRRVCCDIPDFKACIAIPDGGCSPDPVNCSVSRWSEWEEVCSYVMMDCCERSDSLWCDDKIMAKCNSLMFTCNKTCKAIRVGCDTFHLPCLTSVECDTPVGKLVGLHVGDLEVHSICTANGEVLDNVCKAVCPVVRLDCGYVYTECAQIGYCDGLMMVQGLIELKSGCHLSSFNSSCTKMSPMKDLCPEYMSLCCNTNDSMCYDAAVQECETLGYSCQRQRGMWDDGCLPYLASCCGPDQSNILCAGLGPQCIGHGYKCPTPAPTTTTTTTTSTTTTPRPTTTTTTTTTPKPTTTPTTTTTTTTQPPSTTKCTTKLTTTVLRTSHIDSTLKSTTKPTTTTEPTTTTPTTTSTTTTLPTTTSTTTTKATPTTTTTRATTTPMSTAAKTTSTLPPSTTTKRETTTTLADKLSRDFGTATDMTTDEPITTKMTTLTTTTASAVMPVYAKCTAKVVIRRSKRSSCGIRGICLSSASQAFGCVRRSLCPEQDTLEANIMFPELRCTDACIKFGTSCSKVNLTCTPGKGVTPLVLGMGMSKAIPQSTTAKTIKGPFYIGTPSPAVKASSSTDDDDKVGVGWMHFGIAFAIALGLGAVGTALKVTYYFMRKVHGPARHVFVKIDSYAGLKNVVNKRWNSMLCIRETRKLMTRNGSPAGEAVLNIFIGNSDIGINHIKMSGEVLMTAPTRGKKLILSFKSIKEAGGHLYLHREGLFEVTFSEMVSHYGLGDQMLGERVVAPCLVIIARDGKERVVDHDQVTIHCSTTEGRGRDPNKHVTLHRAQLQREGEEVRMGEVVQRAIEEERVVGQNRIDYQAVQLNWNSLNPDIVKTLNAVKQECRSMRAAWGMKPVQSWRSHNEFVEGFRKICNHVLRDGKQYIKNDVERRQYMEDVCSQIVKDVATHDDD